MTSLLIGVIGDHCGPEVITLVRFLDMELKLINRGERLLLKL
jgi:hypothetical protein